VSEDGSLPSYEQMFGETTARMGDDARSVYSPAAYLADLLQLLDDRFEGAALMESRERIKDIPLDAANTLTEVPYLDIVNEVLAEQLKVKPGEDAYTAMTALTAPFAMPFSHADVRRRKYLQLAGVAPERLYRRFATDPDPDVIAREYLGLSRETCALVTTAAPDAAAVKAFYRLDKAELDVLKPVDRFLAATGLTAPELAELLFGRLSATATDPATGDPERTLASSFFVHQGGPPVTVDAEEETLVWTDGSEFEPWQWFERVNRFVRLAHAVALPFTQLDLVLRSLCDNVLDAAALRKLAVVRYLAATLELPLDVACSLVAPMDTLGIGDGDAPADLFDRTFNGRFAEIEGAVVRGSAFVAKAQRRHRTLTCTGDLLAPRNTDFRRRVVRALGLSEADLTAIVQRFRRQYRTLQETGPFDEDELAPAALSLLHRVARLMGALSLAPAELFAVLDALNGDPSIGAHNTFDLLIDTPAREPDCYRILADGTVEDGLWLVQTLVAVVRWMQATDLTGAELNEILGGTAPEPVQEAARRTAAVAVLDELFQQFQPVLLAPEVFVSDRFDERSARVVHDVLTRDDGPVSARDRRLVRLDDPDAAASAAYACLLRLPVIEERDFVGLSLGEHVQQKIFTNLVLRGYLQADGAIVETALPGSEDGFALAGDFDAVGEVVFELIGWLCQEADGDAAVFPSDLESLEDLSPTECAELYDNLVFNRYLDTDGTVLWAEFFAEPSNAAAFWVNADIGAAGPAVWRRLRERVAGFDTEPVALDTEIFAGLRLSADDLERLVENLRFNGYLDADGGYVHKRALLGLRPDGLNLAPEFFPHRRAILDAVQVQLEARHSAACTVAPEDLADIADESLAARIVAELDGTYLVDRRVPDDDELRLFFRDGGQLGLWLDLDAAAEAMICGRIAAVLAAQQPYQLDLAALADLELDPSEVDLLVGALALAGDLSADLTVPYDRVAYFLDARHALEYTVEGFEDFSTDVFFLLHAVATELTQGTAEITARLEEHAGTQHRTFFGALQDGLGIPADTVEAICGALCGGVAEAMDDLLAPVLAAGDGAGRVTAEPADRRFRLRYRRLTRFALLAAKLGLSGVETEVAFRDQDLVGKFPERLVLPPGLTSIDALLPSADGHIYLFNGAFYWRYAAATYEREDRAAVPLRTLSGRFADLARVDAAFVDAAGAEWLIGHDRSERPCAFRREAGSSRWVATPRTWGLIKNNFADPARIDTAFRDAEGKTYLFAGDQYVRYSGDDYAQVDEGYPRTIAGNWAAEGLHAALPPGFETSVDASFHGLDGRTYLFAGGRYAVSGDTTTQPVGNRWGRVRNAFLDATRIDAAYTEGSALYLLVGDQVVRYVDCIENGGVRVDDGYPRRLEQHFEDLQAEFETGIEAAFAEPGAGVHLFKDGRTVSPAPGDRIVRRVDRRWAQLGQVLPSGTVDAAFVGLDGKTYLFSGDRYIRYSGADYSYVDAGFPRLIARDWGGMEHVDAAFVLDGRTHLFGTAETLFRIPVTQEFDRLANERRLDAGDVPPELRERLLTHGLRTAADGRVERRVEGQGPEWTVPLDGGGQVTVRGGADGLTVSAGAGSGQFCVRYSGRSYAEPDPGYPRPLTGDRWNLPDPPAGFASVDAVFTGRDERTYLFAGGRFVAFDNRHRWWSKPKRLGTDWDSIPFDRVDAAFVGSDGKTYVFGDGKYVRFSGDDYTRVDDRYPKTITSYWGNVVNNITRSGHVDAALVVRSPAAEAGGAERTHTYLFSGGQYVRYEGAGYANVDDGYPRDIATSLRGEPRFANLTVPLDGGIDAAAADRRTVYLFSGDRCHAVSTDLYRAYDHLGLRRAGCAFLEDGAVLVEDEAGWRRFSALEGDVVEKTPVRPRVLRAVPEHFRTGLNAVLDGVDGKTYLFKGRSYYDVALGREFPTAEDWGRPRNTIADGEGVDAAFVGRDGKTYVFSGDQFVTYATSAYLDAEVEGHPRPVAEHWGGLTAVDLAYVRDGVTYLFEPPDASGNRRYVVYSGADYIRPDPGHPQVAGADFWGIPAEHRGAESPVAVLFDRDNTLYLTGTQYVAHHAVSGAWSSPRPLARLWPGLPLGTASAALRSAFTGADGVTYFFSREEFTRFVDGQFAPPEPIRRRWGRTRNAIASGTRETAVDAAFVWRGTTYLFSGDQYVRYSGPDYRYVDAGYPRSVVTDLRQEECFRHLPEAFAQTLDDRVTAGEQTVIDAVLANDRTVYLFVDRYCHVVSQSLEATYDLRRFGRIRNNLADTGRVDASFVTGEHTFLFSGDQYVRYSGAEYAFVDEGYPRGIAASPPGELGVTAPPEQFHDGLDAALAGAGGQVYLFRGRQFVRTDEPAPAAQPVAGTWGRVRNLFVSDPYDKGVDAAFVSRDGTLFVFKGDQYLRYRTPVAELADDGYPRSIRDDWGDLPPAFENGLHAAFVFEGTTYFVRDEQYVRYSGGDHRRIDRTYPQPLVRRWGRWADYLLTDLRAVSRFKQLQDRTSDAHGGLAAVLGSRVVTADPYTRLAGLFGWDVDELMWVQRHQGFLPAAPGLEAAFDLELVEAAVELFELATPLGAGPSTVLTDVWTPLYAADPPDTRAAADALGRLLALRYPEPDWAAIERRLHDELNLATRDALVAAVLGQSGDLSTSRDLFDRLYIDVDMGSAATTSRVREAIAAAQLFLHRYLLDLQPVTLRTGDDGPARPEAAKAELRRWWGWMKNYRLWEANRKVYLYPENYIRPELRDTKTPAFAALEDDLLQGEITQASAERAFRRYLDEYTEVSRLTIAGGYVHERDDAGELPWHLVLFGRTKTDPRRYYYRLAEFSREASRSAQWHPWLKVGVQIDSDRVYPVFAFDRVFVFWPTIEDVADTTPTVSFTDSTDGGKRSLSGGAQTTHVVKIYYSFYNLNKEWVPAQALTAEYPIQDTRPISDVRLLVERAQGLSEPASDGDGSGPDGSRETIVVRCSYAVQGEKATTRETRALRLTPELYTKPAVPVSFDDSGADRFTSIFDEPVTTNGNLPALTAGVIAAALLPAANVPAPVAAPTVVMFNTPVESSDGPWFSFDYKGGSFLCKPAPLPPVREERLPVRGVAPERLPDWERFEAAFTSPDGKGWFFTGTEFVEVDPTAGPGSPQAVAARFGRPRNALTETGVVDAVVAVGRYSYVFSGAQYFRYGGAPLGVPDEGYPKPIEANTDNLPRWRRVDAAFTSPGGTTYLVSRELNRFVTSAAPGELRSVPEHWGKLPPPEKEEKEKAKKAAPAAGFFDDRKLDAVVVRGGATYMIAGDEYIRFSGEDYRVADAGYPMELATNTEDLPRSSQVRVFADGKYNYVFDNAKKSYTRTRGRSSETFPIADLARGTFGTQRGIDAACVRGEQLFLVSGTQFVRYTFAGNAVPDFIDAGYPKACSAPVDALVEIGGQVYVFSGDRYGRLAAEDELDSPVELKPIQGNWGNLPYRFRAGLDGAGGTADALYLIRGDRYVRYPRTAPRGVPVALPYELTSAQYEIVRLTTGTAVTLNRRLLAGGVAAVLATATQETDETPAFDYQRSAGTVIKVWPDRVDDGYLPVSSYLDFDSANGIYYWEAFFHAPLLIANALNAAQRFGEAMQWYEYVFDPTRTGDHWRFLPFRAVDVAALLDTCRDAIGVLRDTRRGTAPSKTLTRLLDRVGMLGPLFAQEREARADEATVLRGDLPELVGELRAYLVNASAGLARGTGSADAEAALQSLEEAVAIIGGLERRYDLMMGGLAAAVRRYLDDPFDPHAIAAMRPGAYRRAVVMAYIDNLLDWGDMLFRQYTGESIDEARMLYVLAHDLLGERPRRLGSRPMPDAEYYGQLRHELGEYDMLLRWAGAKAVHASAAPPGDDAYFVVPENTQLADYWTRVEDRLYKIRQSQDILGVGRLVPLFAPPIDPAALVAAAASGVDVAQAVTAAAPVETPHYRFAFLLRRAQELVQRLSQLGNELLAAIERRDAEELSLLQSRHEGAILGLTRAIKEEQVAVARANLAELAESETAARNRQAHYQRLLDQGLSPLEQAQIGLMISASVAHQAAAALKLASGIAHAFPQSKIGLFIAGIETGGDEAGSSLNEFSEFAETFGEGLSVTGEILGVFANHQRMAEDWQLQLSTAKSDVAQIALQTLAATRQVAVAERELEIAQLHIAQNDSVTAFLRDKFANAQLYQWMSGQLSALYLQAYAMAHDMAKAAERAFWFERGVGEGEAAFIRPLYWESRRNGLLAGETLGLDLERMASAYLAADGRGLELTKRISLAELDPVALLRLKSTGACEFALTEAQFDYDFPGHYRRQVRWLSVDFFDADGEPATPNAVLTQLNHKTVLQPDPAAVKYLLDPKGTPPATLRSDWRARQQVALSQATLGEENSGLFRLNLDDDRYLPFEGTGAVSTWRLELTGRRSVDDPGRLADVVVTLRYTADGGDAVFAGAVKGMLKPYPTFRYVDVAAEFPDAWAEFLGGDGNELVLPFSADMFPNMASRQITAIYTRFDVADGSGARMVLNGNPDWTLDDGRVLVANRLSVSSQGSDWRFALTGDKAALMNINLALGYKANVD
jgi:Tc toxin complex TcA C-terminal TcB-binding domain/Neuraminidase-like domain/Hemopexin